MYKSKILLDSKYYDSRITTWELTYPRFVHSELMTHRLFSRNAASSRAIPIKKMIEAVKNDPAMPVWWGRNQSGMQAKEELSQEEIIRAKNEWLTARDKAIDSVERLMEIGLHKQISNRLLEPWMWITVILTATEFDNWFKLRLHPDAQPEIRHLAEMMHALYAVNTPVSKKEFEWHIPMLYSDEENLPLKQRLAIATARCARVSYLTHDNRKDYQADQELHDKLASGGHWSPFEHCAKATENSTHYRSNFKGWRQYRKWWIGEDGTLGNKISFNEGLPLGEKI